MVTQTQADQWDLTIGMMAGDYNVTVWQHAFDYNNTSTGDMTPFLCVDDEWNDMLQLCLTEEGHTPENMQAWWERCVEQGYAMGLYAQQKNDIAPANMTYYVQGDKLTALTGASFYE